MPYSPSIVSSGVDTEDVGGKLRTEQRRVLLVKQGDYAMVFTPIAVSIVRSGTWVIRRGQTLGELSAR